MGSCDTSFNAQNVICQLILVCEDVYVFRTIHGNVYAEITIGIKL